MCLLILGYAIYSVTVVQALDASSAIESLLPIIIATVFYTLGLIATYRHDRTGLLIVSISVHIDRLAGHRWI